MNALLQFLSGKKTYLISLAGIALAIAVNEKWISLSADSLTLLYGLLGFGGLAGLRHGVSKSNGPQNVPIKKISPPGALLLTACACLLFLSACSSDRLAAGGSYAPATTNQVGEVTSQPDVAFFAADSAFDLAYATIDAAFQFEHDNRAWLFKLNPEIKHTLDRIRPTANQIAQKYSEARKLYVEDPTPAGLTTLQLWLSRIQKVTAMATAVLPQEALTNGK